ncbi:MAG: hypothetical protein Tsb0034_19470 [Ekhidna sp.]
MVYISNATQNVIDLHREILESFSSYTSVKSLLTDFAENLIKHYAIGDEKVVVEISNHHPLYIGQKEEQVLHRSFSLIDAQLTIARAYGFEDWNQVKDDEINHDFENAVDYLVEGKAPQLTELIESKTELLESRSSFGHHASLLHYAGSNGVEIWRQKVPENLPDMIRLLLENGAEKDATAFFYGSLHTTYQLAETSAHPQEAEIMDDLLEVLS